MPDAIEILNADGLVYASIEGFSEDGRAWGLAVSWTKGVRELPDERSFLEGVRSCAELCAKAGAHFIDSRVIASVAGDDPALTCARAALHRAALAELGFVPGERRVEYRMDLERAISTLEPQCPARRLEWSRVPADDRDALAHAAEILKRAGQGDSNAHEEDDPAGFISAFLSEEGSSESPERLQLGSISGEPAVFLALLARPQNGWSTIYYLGIVPAFRGRGLGVESMLHGLESLRRMGGRIYHDGTGFRNASARALFAKLGAPPFREMEEWRLDASSRMGS